MALKEKALKRLAEKMKAAGVTWVLSGEYAMQLRGIPVQWHGFELMTDAASAEAADKVLTKLGMRHEEQNPACRAISYHFDGADILLLCAPAVDVVSDQSASVLGVSVPLLKPESQLAWLTMTGREQQAEAFSSALKAKEAEA